ncbi:YbfB/YjiJ family MFS transporter [Rhizobium sp. LjRoot254]|uniref:YbfB/YjiJ family MFS transporter n=1 Tax=Rhizobium sp. LjRoot254 TaxID=3342297 RepID=UPI003ECEC35D
MTLNMTPLAGERKGSSALVVAIAGALSLAIAMGIGRFAFTPLLPMMLHDGLIDINAGSRLATANYLGYLAGALLCMVLPGLLRRFGFGMPDSALLVRFALVSTAVLTLAMAIDSPLLWPLLRFLSGVISGVAFVYTSGWCLARLAELGEPHLSGIIYVGPGIGITLSGLAALALSSAGGSSMLGWAVFGAVASALTAAIWPFFTPTRRVAQKASAPAEAAPEHWTFEDALLTLAYGLAGFGYIVTATFLPVIAREALPGSGWVDLFWPVVGIFVAVGALVTRFVPMTIDRRILLAILYVMQGLGVLFPLMLPNIVGFVIGSVLLGLPFTTITLFGMQEARRLKPKGATVFIGLMTASYGIGQIVGPLVVSGILSHAATHAAGFALSLEVASGSLFFGAILYLVLKKLYPLTEM